jgi:hypothetical protein
MLERISTSMSRIEDIIDVRARTLIQKYAIPFDAVYPLCRQLNAELKRAQQRFVLAVPEAAHAQRYEQMMASAAAVSYALTKQQVVQFPAAVSKLARGIEPELLHELQSLGWRAGRMGGVQDYEFMGDMFNYHTELFERNGRQTVIIDVNQYLINNLESIMAARCNTAQ